MNAFWKRLVSLALALALISSSATTVFAARISTDGRDIRYGTIRVLGVGKSEPITYQAARDDDNGLVYIQADDFAALTGASLDKSGRDEDLTFDYILGGWNLRVNTEKGIGQVSYDFDPDSGDDDGYSLYSDFKMTDCLHDELADTWYFPFEEMMYMIALQWQCVDGTVVIYRPETLLDVLAEYGNMLELTPAYSDLLGEDGWERWGNSFKYGFSASIDELDMTFLWDGVASAWYSAQGKAYFSSYEEDTMIDALLLLQSDLPSSKIESVSNDMDWISDFIGSAATVVDWSDEGMGFEVAHQLIADMFDIYVPADQMDALSKKAAIGAPLLGYSLSVGQTLWIRENVSSGLDLRLEFIQEAAQKRVDENPFWELTVKTSKEARDKYCSSIINAYKDISADTLMTMADGVLTYSLGDNWKTDLADAAAQAGQNISSGAAGAAIGTAGASVAAGLTILNWMNLAVGTIDLGVELAKDASPKFKSALDVADNVHMCRYLINITTMMEDESRDYLRELCTGSNMDQPLLDELRTSTHLMMTSSIHAHELIAKASGTSATSTRYQEIQYILRLLETAKHDGLLLMHSDFRDIISYEPGCIRHDIPVEYVRIVAPVIVMTETIRVQSEHFSATITRPHVYAEANEDLTAAVDAALETIFTKRLNELSSAQASAATCTRNYQTHTQTAKLTSAYSNGGFVALTIGYGYFDCQIGHNVYNDETYVFDVTTGLQLDLPDLWDTANNPDAEKDFLRVLDELMTSTGSRITASHQPSRVSARDIYEESYAGTRVNWDITPDGIYFSIDQLNMGIMIPSLLVPYEMLEGILRDEYLPEQTRGVADCRLEPFRQEMLETDATIYENTPSTYALTVSGSPTNLWIRDSYGPTAPDSIDGTCSYFYAFGPQNYAVTLPEPLYAQYGYLVMWQDDDGDHFEVLKSN